MEKKPANWIQGAVKRPGELTRKAEHAHMTIDAFAHRHAHDNTLTGEQARFALTMRKINRGK